jgi:cyclic pyranopterin monophosphate synthase
MSTAPEHHTRLTHQAADGRPRMVDVGDKDDTERVAVASGVLRMGRSTFEALLAGRTPKGDPLLVAQLAGVQGAKRTSDLIPLCHPLSLTQVDVEVEPDAGVPGVRARATVRVRGRTGVEMEALTAVAVALLAAYDMLKALDPAMTVEAVRVLEKRGGRGGVWQAAAATQAPEGDQRE